MIYQSIKLATTEAEKRKGLVKVKTLFKSAAHPATVDRDLLEMLVLEYRESQKSVPFCVPLPPDIEPVERVLLLYPGNCGVLEDSLRNPRAARCRSHDSGLH